MKRMTLLLCVSFAMMRTIAQETGQADVSDETIREVGVSVVNRFQRAVKKLNDCPLFKLDGTLELFSDKAFIQVSSLRTKGKKNLTPEEYFRTVSKLKCSDHPVYKNMKFDYHPVTAEDGIVSRMGSDRRVSYTITQEFHGTPVKGKAAYCDVTIKEVIISCWTGASGKLEYKIIGVLVQETDNCDGKDTTTASR